MPEIVINWNLVPTIAVGFTAGVLLTAIVAAVLSIGAIIVKCIYDSQ